MSTLVEPLAKLLGATVGFWRVELNLNNGKLIEIRRHDRTPARAVDDAGARGDDQGAAPTRS